MDSTSFTDWNVNFWKENEILSANGKVFETWWSERVIGDTCEMNMFDDLQWTGVQNSALSCGRADRLWLIVCSSR